MKSLRFLFLCGASIGIATGDEIAPVAGTLELYPDGLYPGQNPRPPGAARPRGAGGYEVLTQLTGVTGLRTDAVFGTSAEGAYVLSNLRIASDQTSYDDFLIAYYDFDLATQRLLPSRFERAPAVGIYEPTKKFLIADNTAPINFHLDPATPEQFRQGFQHTFQSGKDYFVNLTKGQRMCHVLSSMPAHLRFRLTITMPDGGTYADSRNNIANFSHFTFTENAVLLSGTYRYRLDPIPLGGSFSYRIRFYNENGGDTTDVSSGSIISAPLGGSADGLGRPYRKFRASLTNGQTITVPADADTETFLVNSRGSIVGGGVNAGLSVTVTEDDDYYIVVAPRDALSNTDEAYNGSVTISDALGFQDWTSAHELAFGRDGAEDDPDRDGLRNLLEYALGTDPARGDRAEAISFSISPSLFTIDYLRPNYLTGVTVFPQFSHDGTAWINGTEVETGTVPGASLVSASASLNDTSGLGRVRVSLVP